MTAQPVLEKQLHLFFPAHLLLVCSPLRSRGSLDYSENAHTKSACFCFPLSCHCFFRGESCATASQPTPEGGGRINTKAMRNPPSPFPLFLFPSSSEGNSSRFPPLFFPLLLSLFRLESLRSQSVATSSPAKLERGRQQSLRQRAGGEKGRGQIGAEKSRQGKSLLMKMGR